MTIVKETKRSTWRRSLMAFVIAATPIAAVSTSVGGALAGEDPEPVIDSGCARQGPFITVTLPNGGGEKFSVDIDEMAVVVEKQAGYINNKKLGLGELISGSTHSVDVYSNDGESRIFIGGDVITLDCVGVAIDCSVPAHPVLEYTTPDDPHTYDVVLYDNIDGTESDIVDSETDVAGDTKVQLHPGGDGTFYLEVTRIIGGSENEKLIDFAVIVVACQHGGDDGGYNGGYYFNFTLPKVTTPPLPKTGNDNSSLLLLAPVMVLLGGGLVLARRRLVEA